MTGRRGAIFALQLALTAFELSTFQAQVLVFQRRQQLVCAHLVTRACRRGCDVTCDRRDQGALRRPFQFGSGRDAEIGLGDGCADQQAQRQKGRKFAPQVVGTDQLAEYRRQEVQHAFQQTAFTTAFVFEQRAEQGGQHFQQLDTVGGKYVTRGAFRGDGANDRVVGAERHRQRAARFVTPAQSCVRPGDARRAVIGQRKNQGIGLINGLLHGGFDIANHVSTMRKPRLVGQRRQTHAVAFQEPDTDAFSTELCSQFGRQGVGGVLEVVVLQADRDQIERGFQLGDGFGLAPIFGFQRCLSGIGVWLRFLETLFVNGTLDNGAQGLADFAGRALGDAYGVKRRGGDVARLGRDTFGIRVWDCCRFFQCEVTVGCQVSGVSGRRNANLRDGGFSPALPPLLLIIVRQTLRGGVKLRRERA